MKAKQCRLAGLAVICLLAGCGGLGKVNQGRVIAYDRDKGEITLISDSNYQEPGNPRYDVLPPVSVHIPEDPKQMGPAPDAGMLMRVDTGSRRLVVFDPASQSLKSIEYTLVGKVDNVHKGDSRAKAAFPVVDRNGKTIAFYLRHAGQILTVSVPDQYFQLPDSTWKAGDEVRYYYKDPSRALRLMNVTKTEIG